MNAAVSQQNRLIQSLQMGKGFYHPVSSIQKLETHISLILLTGEFAYKIKKPLDLGFLDFTTLEKRQYFCQEELRLNRRLAPELYLDVVKITGSPEQPVIGGEGEAIEYAVKMRQFNQESMADQVLARGGFTIEHIDVLAKGVAVFHGAAEVAGPGVRFGNPDSVLDPAIQNFDQIGYLIENRADLDRLARLKQWTEQSFNQRLADFTARKENGFIRECHGDMHLGNIVVVEDTPILFDCIEFSEDFRWIDVMSEVAFLMMDLIDRQRSDLAWRFLNTYLEYTGDFEGLGLLTFYLVYRGMVRAKIAAIRGSQKGIDGDELHRNMESFRKYLSLAESFIQPASPVVIIMHGLSGSGKSTLAANLAGVLPAVRVRSDVERKRLFGLAPLDESKSGINAGIYTGDATAVTYQRLADILKMIVGAGFSGIADATFLKQNQRQKLIDTAVYLKVPYVILSAAAPVNLLRDRVQQRKQAGADAAEADIAVLERQLQSQEFLTPKESNHEVVVDTSLPMDTGTIFELIMQRIGIEGA